MLGPKAKRISQIAIGIKIRARRAGAEALPQVGRRFYSVPSFANRHAHPRTDKRRSYRRKVSDSTYLPLSNTFHLDEGKLGSATRPRRHLKTPALQEARLRGIQQQFIPLKRSLASELPTTKDQPILNKLRPKRNCGSGLWSSDRPKLNATYSTQSICGQFSRA